MRAAGVLCAVVLLLMCSAGTAGAAWDGTVNGTWYQNEIAAGHDGTQDKPFQIHDEGSLAALANETNTNESKFGFYGEYILLMNNLDLNGALHIWTPIGNAMGKIYSNSSKNSKGVFQGTFDGGSHTITGMNVTSQSTIGHIYGGLFGVMNKAALSSISLTNVVVNVQANDGDAFAGGLVGYASSDCSITNCSANGTVTAVGTGSANAGGLVGDNLGSITNCYATGTVTASGTGATSSGGLAGTTHTPITNCYATGTVTASGTEKTNAGGLVGYNYNTDVKNSIALTEWVNVSGTGTITIGRFVGEDTSESNTYAWRHMGLNKSGVITKPVSEDTGGKNATNASTVMIWNNTSFYTNLGWTFGSGGDWKMSDNPNYRLPILAWQNAAPAVDASYLNITHAVTLTFSGSGTVVANRTLPHVPEGATIVFTITGTPDSFTDNGVDKKNEISNNGNKYIIQDLTGDHTIMANILPLPEVEYAVITAYNTTAANITFTLKSSLFNATGAWVNLTNQSSTTDIIAKEIFRTIEKGIPTSVQLTGLTPGQSYQLNITPLNTSVSGGTPIIYTHNSLYTAPVPGITFENAATRTEITDDPLSVAMRQSIVIRANITNESRELTNETISWRLQGFGFTESGNETAYPYNITLRAAAYNANANITVTVSGVTKMLNLTSTPTYPVTVNGGSSSGGNQYPEGADVTITAEVPAGKIFDRWTSTDVNPASPTSATTTFTMPAKAVTVTAVFKDSPVPPVPAGSSDGNMNGAYRVLFDTVGGSSISPATGLSSGDRVAKPADPVRDGFTFGGWYTNEDGTGAWDFTGGIPGDMTLYAAWTAAADEQTTPVTIAATRETTIPQQTITASPVTPAAATEFTVSPTLTEAPAPLAGLLAALLAAGILLRRRE